MIVRRSRLALVVDVDQHVEIGFGVAVNGADARCGVRSAIGGNELFILQEFFEALSYSLVPALPRVGFERRAAIGAELIECVCHFRSPPDGIRANKTIITIHRKTDAAFCLCRKASRVLERRLMCVMLVYSRRAGLKAAIRVARKR